MQGNRKCPFTSRACDGGVIYEDGAVGCGFWVDGCCTWLADVPEGESPRGFYIKALTGSSPDNSQ